jgi:hypothetical protein
MIEPREAERYVSIAKAAKAIGMARGRLREVCVGAGVAVRWGGTDRHPYLKVKLSEARRAVDQQRYVPARAVKRVGGRRLVAVANPDVRC